MGCLKLTYRSENPTLKVVSNNLKISSNSCAGQYRFGFNGYERDDEVKGDGNHLSFADFGYDTRIIRRWNLDPLKGKYPSNSPYLTFVNNPVFYIDPDGLEVEPSDANGSIFPTALTGLGIHMAAQEFFPTKPNWESEITIPYVYPLLGKGRADLIYRDAQSQKIAVWEIKPLSYLKQGSKKRQDALDKMKGYRDGLAKMNTDYDVSIGTSDGTPKPFEGRLQLSATDGLYVYKATLFIPKGKENEGLIYYHLKREGMNPEAAEAWENVKKGAKITGVATAFEYIIRNGSKILEKGSKAFPSPANFIILPPVLLEDNAEHQYQKEIN